MTASHLTIHGLTLAAFRLAVGAEIGGGIFLSQRWNEYMLATGSAVLPVIAVQLARLGMIGGALTAIALYFAAPSLLAASAGILLARSIIIRRGA